MYRLFTLLLALAIGSTQAQEIAITLDDAPTRDASLFTGAERGVKIIAALKKQNVTQVAFFVTTSNISPEGKSRLQNYVKAGHLLGNHSHSHRWIHQMGVQSYCSDIAKADSILKTFAGYKNWFRFPFLDEGRTKTGRDSIRQFLKTLQLSNGYVTIDDYDWYLNQLLRQAIKEKKRIDYEALKATYIEHVWNSIQYYDRVAQNILGRSPKHVLLLHENDLSALFIADLIDHIRTKGWKIISPEEAYTDPISNEVPDVLFNGQGRVAAIARSKNVAAKDLVQDAEDEVYLDNLVKARNIFK
jgi:peptidoglycan/xylan/chitin deacetylase (PgdA/CDA1 family)